MIVVFSNNSVDKPWVREELYTGIAKRINEGYRVIPVIIDDCEVPEALQSVVWVKTKDINNYDQEFNRIVSAI